jgi:hypothetical protein
MSRRVFASVFLCATVLAIATGAAHGQQFSGKFSGFHELGALNAQTGAILSNGEGTITMTLDQNAVTYELTYSGLGSNVTQSHIHFGKVHSSGGIFLFLCTNLGNGPVGTPACPVAGGTVTGTLTADSVLAVPGQNITAGDFGAVIAALMSRTAYANIHTVRFPAGEIRAEVRRHRDKDDDSKQK